MVACAHGVVAAVAAAEVLQASVLKKTWWLKIKELNALGQQSLNSKAIGDGGSLLSRRRYCHAAISRNTKDLWSSALIFLRVHNFLFLLFSFL